MPGSKRRSKPWDVGPGEPGFPFAPWKAPRPAPKPRTVITREKIVEIALAIIDSEGTEAVSMRRIAAELNTGAASLYAYVEGKDQVLHLAHDSVINEFVLDDTAGTSWQDVVRSWSRQMNAIYRHHQDIARLSFAEVPSSPKSLDLVERLMNALITGGLPPQIAAWLLDRIALYIGADAFEGWLYQTRFSTPVDPADQRSPQERGTDWFLQMGGFFRGLPAERYPTIVGNADALLTGDGDSRFAFGVELLIAGATAMAGQPLDRPFDADLFTSGAWFTPSAGQA